MFRGLLLLTALAVLPAPSPVGAAQAPQILFLGDRLCGEYALDCAFPLQVSQASYLHVVLHTAGGDYHWQVLEGADCASATTVLIDGVPTDVDGYAEVVAPIPAGTQGCVVLDGRDGFAVTYYAAYLDARPQPDAAVVFPDYLSLQGRPDLPDLDVTLLSRSPRYDYDARKNRPDPGDLVTYTATVRNASPATLPPFTYRWLYDGRVVGSGSSGSLPGEASVALPLVIHWRPGTHTLRFAASELAAQISTSNDTLAVRTNALLVGFWVERSAYEYFNTYQWSYCQARTCTGSDSFEDWLQRQMTNWNRMFSAARYPHTSPAGIVDRVALDELTVVPDGALPLHGGRATNAPDAEDKTVDMQWGMIARDVQAAYPRDGNGGFNLDLGLLHELGHARSLADYYRFDIHADATSTITVTYGGRPIYDAANPYAPTNRLRPFVSFRGDLSLFENAERDLMDCTCEAFYSAYSALLWNRLQGKRARCGNINPPCNIGDWYRDIPARTELRIVSRQGTAVRGASIVLYSDQGTTYAGHAFDDAHARTVPIRSGLAVLPHDTFSAGGSDWQAAHNDLLLRVTDTTGPRYCFLEPAPLNMAYWEGYRTSRTPAIMTLDLRHIVHNSCNLSLPPVLVNEPFATSPLRSRVWLSRAPGASAETVVHVVLRDGARHPHAMRDRVVSAESLSCGTSKCQKAHGISNDAGYTEFQIPTAALPARLVDRTDNNLVVRPRLANPGGKGGQAP